MASMMDKVQEDKKMDGAYGWFVKPNPSAFKPLDGKVKGLLGAKANKERLEK